MESEVYVFWFKIRNVDYMYLDLKYKRINYFKDFFKVINYESLSNFLKFKMFFICKR